MPPSQYIDMNGDGIDDNTGEVIPKDSIIKIIAEKENNTEDYKKITFSGNGKVFWTDGKSTIAEKKVSTAPVESQNTNDDLPF